MSAKPPGEFPHTLHRVQFGTIGRQEIESNAVTVLIEPWLETFGMMPTGIVNDDNHETVPAPVTKKLYQERQKRLCVEFLTQRSHQAPIGVTDSSENTDALAGRRMKHDGIDILGRHPHGTTGAVLLEMAFIFVPEVNHEILGDSVEFFYMPAAKPGRYGQSVAGVCVCGTPSA